ncbi:hypothetical protein [Caloramator sp. Dgby_cultured_2]|uniref:hypothetical protein n=1 Tax=Caloramator sp. Dgby_cultured_2 TaxID=3029174 RepID=UPI00237D5E05|nr:hypothetical protein [Caloramator sp. Dgby_cultured_2]WDU82056.1 hypothetical protein PWK10_09625 [Caloramator sp. Dgby_cultured_2]
MHALILLADNIYLTPYISFYFNVLDKLNIDYKIIYWDKNNNEDIKNPRYMRFSYKYKSKISKILGYIKFRKSIIDEINRNNYTIVVPLHSILAFILFDLLIFNFKKNIYMMFEIIVMKIFPYIG